MVPCKLGWELWALRAVIWGMLIQRRDPGRSASVMECLGRFGLFLLFQKLDLVQKEASSIRNMKEARV